MNKELETILQHPRMLFLEMNIRWFPPKEIKDFHQPYVEVRICLRKEGKVQTFAQRTGGEAQFDKLMISLYSQFVHPAIRPLIREGERELMVQFMDIKESEPYKNSLAQYKEWAGENKVNNKHRRENEGA